MNTFNVFIPVEYNITLNLIIYMPGCDNQYISRRCSAHRNQRLLKADGLSCTHPSLVLTNTRQIIVLIGSKGVLTGLPGEVFSTK